MPRTPEWIKTASPIASLRNDPYDQLPTLLRIAGNLFQFKEKASKAKRVFTLIAAALPRLPDEEHRAAHKLFDLDSGIAVVSLQRRQQDAGKQLDPPIDVEAFSDNRDRSGKHEQRIILAVGQAIFELHETLQGNIPRVRNMAGGDFREPFIWPYVERPTLEKLFAEALENHRVILFVGDKGVGKTRLAKELCIRHEKNQHGRSIFIDDGRDSWSSDQRYEMYGEGSRIPGVAIPTPGFDFPVEFGTEEVVVARFGEMLTANSAPPFLVVDDVRNVSLVNNLIEVGVKAVIFVLTATEKLDGCFKIDVPPMTVDEATKFVQSCIEDISDDEVRVLIDAAGYRPLAIEQACRRLVRDTENRIDDVLHHLKFSPLVFFEMADVPWRRRISTHYRRLLDMLSREEPAATRLIELLCMRRNTDLGRGWLSILLGRSLGITAEWLQQEVFDEAARILQYRSIVAFDTSGETYIGSLTTCIFRDLLGSRKESILEELYTIVDAELRRCSQEEQDFEGFKTWRKVWHGLLPSKNPQWARIRYDSPRYEGGNPSYQGGGISRLLYHYQISRRAEEFMLTVDAFLSELEAINEATDTADRN